MHARTHARTQAGDLFIGAFRDGGTLVGFICSTRCSAKVLTHDSMEIHEPEGVSVCIHSVCVDGEHRRKGIASGMLKHYIERAPALIPKVERLLLIAHEELLPL